MTPWDGDPVTPWDGDHYQRRFDALAEAGTDVHGEADFVARLHPSSVLDAGCGTGRVARELARPGIEVVGVDADGSMIATAARLAPELQWEHGDVAQVDLGRQFDVVVMAGNVPLFTAAGTHAALVAGCARHLDSAGCLVAGFQLDRGYTVEDYDHHCHAAGLILVDRYATWSCQAYDDSSPYAVSVHRCRPPTRDPRCTGEPFAGPVRSLFRGVRAGVRSAIMGRAPDGPGHHRKDSMRNPMFVYDEQLTNLILDYCRWRLALDPVPLDFGGAQAASLDATLKGLITPAGTDAHRVMEIFDNELATAVVSCDSPRFLSFIPAAPTKASLLFDMVVACSSLQGTSWMEAAGAVAAENQALRVLSDLAHLPDGAGGCFVSGGSAGNLSALMVARDTAGHRMGSRAPDRPVVAISEEAHSSVGKALGVLGVEPLLVACDDHRLTGAALRSALDASPRSHDVIAVVATGGTTNAGIIDDLSGVGEIAKERSLWFHVDGAYGCAALFAPSIRARFDGIELVDSFVVDPHKWLFAPFDCAALLYREPHLAKAVHTQDASYLDVLHSDAPEEWNPSDYAYHLTRRARGLPLWFSLAVNGTDAYRDAIETVLAVTQQTADLIERTPHVELVRRPELSVVLFRRTGWDRERYEQWSDQLLRDQVGFVVPTTWEGESVGRLALLHPDTTIEMIEEILATTA